MMSNIQTDTMFFFFCIKEIAKTSDTMNNPDVDHPDVDLCSYDFFRTLVFYGGKVFLLLG